jgi:hypothetical protein
VTPTKKLTLIALAVLVNSCVASGPLDPDERDELARARRRWAAKGITEYKFETRAICFCDPAVLSWTEVHVRNDSVVAVRIVEPYPGATAPTALQSFPTVTRLFDSIESASANDYIKTLSAEYDAEYGYPRRIDMGCEENTADCGVTYLSRNLRPVR